MGSLYAASDGWYPRSPRRKAKPASCNPYVVWVIVVWLVLGVFWTLNKKMNASEKANSKGTVGAVHSSQHVGQVVALTRS